MLNVDQSIEQSWVQSNTPQHQESAGNDVNDCIFDVMFSCQRLPVPISSSHDGANIAGANIDTGLSKVLNPLCDTEGAAVQPRPTTSCDKCWSACSSGVHKCVHVVWQRAVDKWF